MKKLFTFLVFTLLAASVFSATFVEKVTWEDGSTSNKVLHPGDVITVKVTYTSDVDTTIYITGNSKDAANATWGLYWLSSPKSIVASVTSTTVDALITVPTDVALDPSIRVFCTGAQDEKWGSRLKNATGGNSLAYGSIVAVPSFISTLEIDTLTWEDGSSGAKVYEELENVTVKVEYDAAQSADSLYVLVASKDNWSVNWVAEKITFPDVQGEISVNFDLRAFSSVADENALRVFLGPLPSSAWGDRVDVDADGAGGNDALYATIAEAGVVEVEQATAMQTDHYDVNAIPTGGVYELGDSVALTVNYNSTNASVFYVRFKTKDNVTKFFEYNETLPSTTADTSYTFKVKIPDATAAYDSMRIVGWIGSWSAEKELETFIDVTAGTATRISSLTSIVFNVYPNPATSLLTVAAYQGAVIRVFNTAGVTVRTCKALSAEEVLSVADLTTGIYFVSVDDKMQKVMIK